MALQGLLIAGGRFEVAERLGGGSFSEVYIGIDRENGRRVCIKFEDSRVEMAQSKREADIYARLQGGVGIPTLYWHGEVEGPEDQQHRQYLALVMQLLGQLLTFLFPYILN